MRLKVFGPRSALRLDLLMNEVRSDGITERVYATKIH